MKETPTDEGRIRRYLLGELSEADMSQLEDNALAGPDGAELQAAIESAENDLMDEYARGELSPGERARFEARFLTSARRRGRVALAAALASGERDHEAAALAAQDVAQATTTTTWARPPVSAQATHDDARLTPGGAPTARLLSPLSALDSLLALLRPPSPAFKFAVVSLAFALAAGGAWYYISESSRRRAESARVEAERRHTEERALAEEPARAQPGPRGSQEQGAAVTPNATPASRAPAESPANFKTHKPRGPARTHAPALASFTLLPGSLRGEGDWPGQALHLPRGGARLRLVLDGVVSGGASAELFAGERKVLSRAGLRVRRSGHGGLVTLDVPAGLLAPGPHLLRLECRDLRGDTITTLYSFRVVSR